MTPSRKSNDYLPCEVYRAHVSGAVHPRYPRMVSFDHADGKFYFLTLTADGELEFRSEGYPNPGAREVGMKSVDRFRTKPTRYSSLAEEGRYYTILLAQNGEEIVRSCGLGSAAAAEALLPQESAASIALAERAAAAEAEAAATEAEAAATVSARDAEPAPKREDDYLVCSAYEARLDDSPHPEHPGAIFFKHANNKYYFATLQDDRSLALRSQGYPTAGAATRGLESVLRNRSARERVKIEERRGLYFAVLYAGNHQEIARSCPLREEAAALALLPVPMPTLETTASPADEPGEGADFVGGAVLGAAGAAGAGAALGALHLGGNQEAHGPEAADASSAATVPDAPVAEEAPTPAPLPPAEQTDALPTGAPTPDGPTVEAPTTELGEVEPAALTATRVGGPPAEITPLEVQDNYLDCGAYSRRKINDKVNRVALFRHENGLYYFAIFDGRQEVRLRSEGFASAKARDQELSGALRFLDDESRYGRIRDADGRYVNVLRDETGREVGRSCPSGAIVPFVLPLAGAGAMAGAMAAAAGSVTTQPVVAPAASPAATPVSTPVTPVTPRTPTAPVVPPRDTPLKPAPAAGTRHAGPAWWVWALLSLLALVLFWLLLRGCNDGGAGAAAG